MLLLLPWERALSCHLAVKKEGWENGAGDFPDLLFGWLEVGVRDGGVEVPDTSGVFTAHENETILDQDAGVLASGRWGRSEPQPKIHFGGNFDSAPGPSFQLSTPKCLD